METFIDDGAKKNRNVAKDTTGSVLNFMSKITGNIYNLFTRVSDNNYS